MTGNRLSLLGCYLGFVQRRLEDRDLRQLPAKAAHFVATMGSGMDFSFLLDAGVQLRLARLACLGGTALALVVEDSAKGGSAEPRQAW